MRGQVPSASILVNNDHVEEITCHRLNSQAGEEYLIRWVVSFRGDSTDIPHSWHGVSELGNCGEKLQEYLDTLPQSASGRQERQNKKTSKHHRQDIKVYNGKLDVQNGMTVGIQSQNPDIPRVDILHIVTDAMQEEAAHTKTTAAAALVRKEILRRLSSIPGPTVSLVNNVDDSSPPLSFTFIDENILGEGVYAAHVDTITGCLKCKAHMGQGIGCEYSKLCDCLEYAAVNDTERMLPEERNRWEQIQRTGEGDTSGLPKKFPYYSSGPRVGCLVPFYLDRRHPIYECNSKCNCGPNCKTRVVQHGRQVRLELFKTANNRGWGIRAKDRLRKGQFIDTYRGEIITDAEASRREKGNNLKDSYLYSLDKFADTCGFSQEEMYVVDGQFYGNITRFINHSCEPNCRQYVVAYNRHDPKVYEIAFFATRDIAPDEELTFDYLDKDEGDEDDDDQVDPDDRKKGGMKPTRCRCGSEKCRKYLWL